MRPLFFVGDAKCYNLARYFVEHGGDMAPMDNYAIRILPDQLPIVRGMWDSHIDRMEWLKAKGHSFAFVDNAYFLRHSKTFDGCYRVSVNQMQESKLIEFPDDRWKQFKSEGACMAEWKNNPHGPIIICPPTPQPTKLYNLFGWTERTVERIKELLPDKQIIVRDKPRGGALTSDNFHKAIDGAYCVVTFNSIAAVEAAMYGIPVVVDESSAASSVGVTSIDKITELVRPDRRAWVNMLAYSQYSMGELYNGTAWKRIISRL